MRSHDHMVVLLQATFRSGHRYVGRSGESRHRGDGCAQVEAILRKSIEDAIDVNVASAFEG
jgi:hypothetical protein